jgi:hypothetical protein
LEARGPRCRGRVPLPELSSSGKLALKSLLGRPLGKTVDLAAVEAGLARLGIGDDLALALSKLGHDVSGEGARRRANRAERKEALGKHRFGVTKQEWEAEQDANRY